MSNITDLQNWYSGLPAASTWNVAGFNTHWHADQVRKGHMFLPSIFMPLNGTPGQYNTSADPATINDYITKYAADIKWLSSNSVPLCLRTNNITDAFKQAKYYGQPLNKSVHTWSRDAAGNLTENTRVDTFGPDQPFADEGAALGGSPYVKALAALYPAPPWLQYLENNEGIYEDYLDYCVTSNKNLWLTNGQVNLKSARMEDYLSANTWATPSLYADIFYHARQRKYAMYYGAFASFSPWFTTTPIFTAAYGASMTGSGFISARAPDPKVSGYTPEALCYDAGSKPIYVSYVAATGKGNYWNFTALDQSDAGNQIPAWQWLESRHANHHREFSLNLGNGGALAGAKNGKHLVVTPAIYEGWCQWLLWTMRDKGVPVMLRQWTPSNARPGDAFWNASDVAWLTSAGESEQAQALTQGDYFAAIQSGPDLICGDATLRDFWLSSDPVRQPLPSPTSMFLQRMKYPPYPQDYRVLPVDCNTPQSAWTWDQAQNKYTGVNKVWAVAAQKGSDVLLYVYSPCAMSGKVSVSIPGVGPVAIDAPQPWAYWLVSGGNVRQLPLSTGLVYR